MDDFNFDLRQSAEGVDGAPESAGESEEMKPTEAKPEGLTPEQQESELEKRRKHLRRYGSSS